MFTKPVTGPKEPDYSEWDLALALDKLAIARERERLYGASDADGAGEKLRELLAERYLEREAGEPEGAAGTGSGE